MTRSLRTALVAALALSALCLLPAAPAQAAQGMEVAIQDDPVFTYRYYYDRDRALQQARDLQVTRIRTNLLWSVAVGKQANNKRKPKRIRYHFGAYDGIVEHAARYGIRVQLGLTGPAPRWATGNRKIGGRRPKLRLYRHFVAAAARHFRGRVDRYAIWNEPNYKSWLSPRRKAPRIYRRLYLRGYRQIKKVDRNAQVLIGETSPYGSKGRAMAPLKFLRRMTCANKRFGRKSGRRCGRLRADGYAHHAYDFSRAPSKPYPGRNNATIGSLGRLTRALDRLARARLLSTPGGRPLDVYITEFGYLQSGRKRLSQSRRAAYLTQAFDIAQRNPRVRQMLNYLLVQPTRRYRFFDTSLVSLRGNPFKSYTALREWAAAAAADGRIATVPSPQPPPGDGGGGGGGDGGGGGGGGGGPVPAPTPPPPEPEPEPEPPPPGDDCPLPLGVPCPSPL